ncbi:MAG: sigma-70 family RNA polymerase sigma factor [Microcystis panniformis]
MSLAQPSEDTSPSKEEIYQALLRSLTRRKGFGIVFVQSSPLEAQRLIQRVQQDLPQKKVATLQLTEPINNLYELIEGRSDRNELNILFVQGLEKSLEPFIKPGFGGEGDYYNIDTVPGILSHLNQRREIFRDRFSNICFVFILPAFAIKYFIRRAPDFFDWGTGVFRFPLDSETLSQELSGILSKRSKNNYSGFSLKEGEKLLLKIQQLIDECDNNKSHLADLLFEQGLVLQGIKKYREAVSSYKKALQLNSEDPDVLNNLGLALFDYGLFEKAIINYDKALKIQPDYYYAWDNRGDALRALGRFSEAIDSYNQALQLKPDDQTAWDSLFKTLVEADNPESNTFFAFIKRSLRQFNLDSYYDPSDIISEAYIRGVRSISSGRVITNPLAWIRMVSHNIIRELSRNQNRQKADIAQLQDSVIFEPSNIEDDLELVQLAFKHLSPEDREIITLRTIEGLSWSEISKRLESDERQALQVAVLRKRGERAMQRLRKIYHSLQPEDPPNLIASGANKPNAADD